VQRAMGELASGGIVTMVDFRHELTVYCAAQVRQLPGVNSPSHGHRQTGEF
jgi:hypothetical protein